MKPIKVTLIVNVPDGDHPIDVEDAVESAIADTCWDWDIEELYAEEVE